MGRYSEGERGQHGRALVLQKFHTGAIGQALPSALPGWSIVLVSMQGKAHTHLSASSQLQLCVGVHATYSQQLPHTL